MFSLESTAFLRVTTSFVQVWYMPPTRNKNIITLCTLLNVNLGWSLHMWTLFILKTCIWDELYYANFRRKKLAPKGSVTSLQWSIKYVGTQSLSLCLSFFPCFSLSLSSVQNQCHNSFLLCNESFIIKKMFLTLDKCNLLIFYFPFFIHKEKNKFHISLCEVFSAEASAFNMEQSPRVWQIIVNHFTTASCQLLKIFALFIFILSKQKYIS